ncbi:MAG: LTA synthase family protein [Bacteroidia bacterium]
MLSALKFLIRLIVLWLLFFFFFRIIFLFTQFSKASGEGFSEIIKVFYSGIFLDLSAVCYILSVPFVLLLLQLFIKGSFLKTVNLYFHAIVLFIFVGLGLANIIIYKEWGTLFNSRALYYATEPKEVFASVSNLEWLISLSVWTLIFLLFFYLFRKRVHKYFPAAASLKLTYIIELIVCLGLILLGGRGGLRQIPINESAAYFSTKPLLNLIATNNIWYLGHSLLQSHVGSEKLYKYYDDTLAEDHVKQLYKFKNDSTIQILNIDPARKPNVVIIMLESWSADIVKAIGGEENVAPEIDRLKNDGILFSNIYSAGFRTDQGIVSILSGFPAQPNTSIIRYPEKTEKLPSLIREFKDNNYGTSFYYGGEIGFANMNSYFLNSGCNRIITQNDFQKSKLSNKWGVYDEFVLDRHAADLNHEKEPFLSVLLTLSTHEPFDIPIKNPFGDATDPDKFRGAAFYTDQCLGSYFKKVKEEPWFNNTLFILLGDHGHKLPKENNYDDPRARRMTMMFYGNLIKPEFKGKVLNMIANQNDLAATLLSQLGMKHDAFEWSNNIFNARRNNFAYISLDYGMNWLTPKGYFTYHFDTGKIDYPRGKTAVSTADVTNAKSYIQCLYRKFLDY